MVLQIQKVIIKKNIFGVPENHSIMFVWGSLIIFCDDLLFLFVVYCVMVHVAIDNLLKK